MPIYQKRSYKVEAEQFNGSIESVEAIINLGLSPLHVPEGMPHKLRRADEFSKSKQSIQDTAPPFLAVTLNFGEAPCRVDAGWFIVKEPDGTFNAYGEAGFKETFITTYDTTNVLG